MRVGSCGLNFAKGGIGTCCQDCCAKAMELMEMGRQIVSKHFAASVEGSTNLESVNRRPDFGPELVEGTSRNALYFIALPWRFGESCVISRRRAAPAALTSETSREILRPEAGLRMTVCGEDL